jgi:ubiquinone/menaquinone biosynthesis C-methylase UbiE
MPDTIMPDNRMPDFITPSPITKLAYQTVQQGKSLFSVAHKLAANTLVKQLLPMSGNSTNTSNPTSGYRYEEAPKVDQAMIQEVRGRLDALLQTDWQDAEDGVYPASLLFDNPWEEFLWHYPGVWLERANQKRFRDFDASIDTDAYPKYYTQNFHYQTGGYLSDDSADLYDLQVELLFSGGADPMRRRVLAPLKAGINQAFANIPAKQLQILDVACGTGRTLKMLRGTFPQASLQGVDLSDAYLRKASQMLSQDGMLTQLLQGKGEALPYRDDYFHGITCVFLFHELPGPVRQGVINEAFRVIKPGGTFIICDSIQIDDSPNLIAMMEGFAKTFHEPFYRDYVRDDLQLRLSKAGFEGISTQVHYMSKYLIARKPVVEG